MAIDELISDMGIALEACYPPFVIAREPTPEQKRKSKAYWEDKVAKLEMVLLETPREEVKHGGENQN